MCPSKTSSSGEKWIPFVNVLFILLIAPDNLEEVLLCSDILGEKLPGCWRAGAPLDSLPFPAIGPY
jgi:hypothetical protein